jgi:hypothetical protein
MGQLSACYGRGGGQASGINHPAGEFKLVKTADDRRRCG